MTTSSSDKSAADTTVGSESQISGTTARAKEKAAELGRAASETLNDQRRHAASGLDSAASTIRARADQLPGGETVSGVAHSTADALSSTADYVRKNDLGDMWADVEGMVKRNPGPSLLAAAFVGFLVGRAFAATE
jgi:ElaB/YqjD/DUF883 family membrane-anchored ribosome-binding protein